MTSETVDPEIFVEYQGRKICLCCEDCQFKFESDPQKYLASLAEIDAEDMAALKADAAPQAATDPPAVAPSAPEPTQLTRSLRFIARFHPLLVHFPVGLIVMAGLMEILWLIRSQGSNGPSQAAVILSAIAVIPAWAAGIAGLLNGSWLPHPQSMAQTLSIHRWLGITVMALSIPLSYQALRIWRAQDAALTGSQSPDAAASTIPASDKSVVGTSFFRLLLFATTIIIIFTGHFGGMMTFGKDYLFRW